MAFELTRPPYPRRIDDDDDDDTCDDDTCAQPDQDRTLLALLAALRIEFAAATKDGRYDVAADCRTLLEEDASPDRKRVVNCIRALRAAAD